MSARTSSSILSSLVLVSALAPLLACKADATEPTPDTAASATKTEPDVGYDIRRLRPRNEEPLADMFERMRKQALADGKQVAVLFSADWCEPCRLLDTELGNTHPASHIGHVRILELKEEDWEAVTRMNEFNDLRTRWSPVLNTYPLFVLLDAQGNAVEEMNAAIDRLNAAGIEATVPNWFSSRSS